MINYIIIHYHPLSRLFQIIRIHYHWGKMMENALQRMGHGSVKILHRTGHGHHGASAVTASTRGAHQRIAVA